MTDVPSPLPPEMPGEDPGFTPPPPLPSDVPGGVLDPDASSDSGDLDDAAAIERRAGNDENETLLTDPIADA